MKKIIIILCLSILCIYQTSMFFNIKINEDFANAKAEKTTYAKAKENCILYRSQNFDNNLNNIYFIIPETYFVTLIDKISDECFKVQYDKFVGYTKASNLTIATFTPIVKTLENITLDIKSSSGTQVWSSPSADSQILTTISAGFKNIKYIASCYGSIPSGGENNLWHYISYTPKDSTNVYEGYVYAQNTTNLSPISANTETNPEIIKNENLDNTIYLSSSLKTIIITIITIPIIIFLLIILYKSSKKLKNFTTKTKNQQTDNSNSTSSLQQFSNENNFQNNHQNNTLKENLSQMKDLTLMKKSNSLHSKNSTYPTFPDYDPDDDIL